MKDFMFNRILVFILAGLSVISAQSLSDWEIITYMNDISSITESEGFLWTGNSGGIYRYNFSDNTIRKFNNLDGLASLEISSVTKDKRSNLIAGSYDGIIHIKKSGSDLWQPYFEMQGESITDVYAYEDTLWVAANSGVGVFLNTEEGLEFRDFYNNFPVGITASTVVHVFNNRLFFGTNAGLLHASANFLKQNLKIAQAWQVITTAQGLPSNQINDVNTHSELLYVGTELGPSQIDKSFTLSDVPGYNSGTVRNIITDGSRLVFTRARDYYTQNGSSWIYGTRFDYDITCGHIFGNEELWFGFKEQGIRAENRDTHFLVDGPASNHVGNLIKDSRGILWMASGKFKLDFPEGFYKYDFDSWTNYKFSPAWNWKNSTVTVYEDSHGKIWFGSWGGGVTIIDGDQFEFIHAIPEPGELTVSGAGEQKTISFDALSAERRRCLVGANISQTDNYTVSTHFIEDRNNNFWIANYLARFPEYIGTMENYTNPAMPGCENWMYFGDNIGMSLDEGEISSFTLENIGDRERLWFGTFSKGIRVLDHKNTISDPSDDIYYDDNDLPNEDLFSQTILSLKTDLDGVIWIGTAGGLNSYQAGSTGGGAVFFRHVGETGPIENKINSIFVDASNNKWFATDGGLSILMADKSPWDPGAWVHYTTQNSGLPNPIVNSVFVDESSGEAYLGTESGLAIFRGSFAEIRPDMEMVTGGPNPFIIESGNEYVIKNLAINSQVKIFNISGILVRRLSSDRGTVTGSRATWDGNDETGTTVPSGIYIFLVYNEQGQTGTGKIAVLRP
jgi:ligand-binding sensor domain-containing protein